MEGGPGLQSALLVLVSGGPKDWEGNLLESSSLGCSGGGLRGRVNLVGLAKGLSPILLELAG